jgi:hypothetical protein
MATRKHRARRAKTFRHEHVLVDYDDEGNEIQVTASELRARKETPEKAKAKTATPAKGRSRATRVPQPPSWRRSLRRGAMWGSATVVASVLLLRSASLPARVLIGAFYAAMFIPMTYWLDGMVYRKYLKKTGDGQPSRPGKTR